MTISAATEKNPLETVATEVELPNSFTVGQLTASVDGAWALADHAAGIPATSVVVYAEADIFSIITSAGQIWKWPGHGLAVGPQWLGVSGGYAEEKPEDGFEQIVAIVLDPDHLQMFPVGTNGAAQFNLSLGRQTIKGGIALSAAASPIPTKVRFSIIDTGAEGLVANVRGNIFDVPVGLWVDVDGGTAVAPFEYMVVLDYVSEIPILRYAEYEGSIFENALIDGRPMTDYAIVGHMLVQDSVTVGASGPMAWRTYAAKVESAIADHSLAIRSIAPLQVVSGLGFTVVPDNAQSFTMDLQISAGAVANLEFSPIPGRTVFSNGVMLANDFTTNYTTVSDIADIQQDALGGSFLGNNYFRLKFAMSLPPADNPAGGRMYCILPDGNYGNATDASSDVNRLDNAIPALLDQSSVPVCVLVIRRYANNRLLLIATEDIRPLPSQGYGGFGNNGDTVAPPSAPVAIGEAAVFGAVNGGSLIGGAVVYDNGVFPASAIAVGPADPAKVTLRWSAAGELAAWIPNLLEWRKFTGSSW